MKRLIALSLSAILLLVGCSQNVVTSTNESVPSIENNSSSVAEDADLSTEESGPSETEIAVADITDLTLLPVAEGEEVDTSDYVYEVDFSSLDSDGLQDYVEDSFYDSLLTELDGTDCFVSDIETVYISQEYIDELAYNSQVNVFFGYTLAELDEQFSGQRYVFTLSDQGDTIVTAFESYDDTYNRAIKNVSVGTGVILLSVTISAGGALSNKPAVTMIFAFAAATGTIVALSAGTIAAVAAAIYTGIQTGDMEAAKKAAALIGSEAFMWGSIVGTVAGGTYEAIQLHGATELGLTMNQVAQIQMDEKWSLDIIRQFHSMEEYQVFKDANLFQKMINGKDALIRTDIDLNYIDDLGRTNLQRMLLGLSPLDPTGKEYQLHHIGQMNDATLAILTDAEHHNAALHGFVESSNIDRVAFRTTRQQFWKTMAAYLSGL